MDVLVAALLGVVQGVTEFLPVSSSAHLILAKAFFGWDAERFGVAFDVACHVGTLAAVLVYFRDDLAALLRALPTAAFAPGQDAHRIRLIAVGTVPVAIMGLLLADFIESSTRTPAIAATALLVGAVLLLAIERLRPTADESALTYRDALLIGTAQATALIPGVSRSGATIAAAMALGVRREVAARFTFLLSIPAIAGAGVREALVLRGTTFGTYDAGLFVVGMTTSALVGYLTVKYFVRFLASHRLDVFAWYRVVLALATFGWLYAR